MHAVVLSPGPSLANLPAPPPGCRVDPTAGLTICVNRAALRFGSDVWACLDYPVIRDHGPMVLDKPLLLTRRQTWQDIGHRCGMTLATTTDDMRAFFPPELGWTLYTVMSAIVYAALRGATRIDLYGADMHGTEGYDAEDKGENRSPARWKTEREILDKVTAEMAKRGVEVRRCGIS